ncbi:hypothetical protein [Glutamicibacter sp. TV12E]|uniref:hypothetical protein n=1 Tax=Glutamicibacter sp. TV12E TaxID=3446362 RepID=UPI004034BF3E
MIPQTPMPAPGPRGMDDAQVEQALSSLADHDITEHAEVYEQMLEGLQQELNRAEHSR